MENNEIMVQQQTAPNMPAMSNNMMPQFNDINQGTVAIEASRAIAEAQGKLVIAKRFPRNEVAAYAKAMDKGTFISGMLSLFCHISGNKRNK